MLFCSLKIGYSLGHVDIHTYRQTDSHTYIHTYKHTLVESLFTELLGKVYLNIVTAQATCYEALNNGK